MPTSWSDSAPPGAIFNMLVDPPIFGGTTLEASSTSAAASIDGPSVIAGDALAISALMFEMSKHFGDSAAGTTTETQEELLATSESAERREEKEEEEVQESESGAVVTSESQAHVRCPRPVPGVDLAFMSTLAGLCSWQQLGEPLDNRTKLGYAIGGRRCDMGGMSNTSAFIGLLLPQRWKIFLGADQLLYPTEAGILSWARDNIIVAHIAKCGSYQLLNATLNSGNSSGSHHHHVLGSETCKIGPVGFDLLVQTVISMHQSDVALMLIGIAPDHSRCKQASWLLKEAISHVRPLPKLRHDTNTDEGRKSPSLQSFETIFDYLESQTLNQATRVNLTLDDDDNGRDDGHSSASTADDPVRSWHAICNKLLESANIESWTDEVVLKSMLQRLLPFVPIGGSDEKDHHGESEAFGSEAASPTTISEAAAGQDFGHAGSRRPKDSVSFARRVLSVAVQHDLCDAVSALLQRQCCGSSWSFVEVTPIFLDATPHEAFFTTLLELVCSVEMLKILLGDDMVAALAVSSSASIGDGVGINGRQQQRTLETLKAVWIQNAARVNNAPSLRYFLHSWYEGANSSPASERQLFLTGEEVRRVRLSNAHSHHKLKATFDRPSHLGTHAVQEALHCGGWEALEEVLCWYTTTNQKDHNEPVRFECDSDGLSVLHHAVRLAGCGGDAQTLQKILHFTSTKNNHKQHIDHNDDCCLSIWGSSKFGAFNCGASATTNTFDLSHHANVFSFVFDELLCTTDANSPLSSCDQDVVRYFLPYSSSAPATTAIHLVQDKFTESAKNLLVSHLATHRCPHSQLPDIIRTISTRRHLKLHLDDTGTTTTSSDVVAECWFRQWFEEHPRGSGQSPATKVLALDNPQLIQTALIDTATWMESKTSTTTNAVVEDDSDDDQQQRRKKYFDEFLKQRVMMNGRPMTVKDVLSSLRNCGVFDFIAL